MDADVAAVYRGSVDEPPLVLSAGHGLPPEAMGFSISNPSAKTTCGCGSSFSM